MDAATRKAKLEELQTNQQNQKMTNGQDPYRSIGKQEIEC